MGGIEGLEVLVIGIAVVLFVPVLVWAIAIVGLRRIVRDKIRENCLDKSYPVQESRQPMGHN